MVWSATNGSSLESRLHHDFEMCWNNKGGEKALEQVQVPDSDLSTKLTICQNAIIDSSEFRSPAPLAVVYNGS